MPSADQIFFYKISTMARGKYTCLNAFFCPPRSRIFYFTGADIWGRFSYFFFFSLLNLYLNIIARETIWHEQFSRGLLILLVSLTQGILRLDGSSEHGVHIWSKSDISICWSFGSIERPILLHTCATCSEQPSYIRTMH